MKSYRFTREEIAFIKEMIFDANFDLQIAFDNEGVKIKIDQTVWSKGMGETREPAHELEFAKRQMNMRFGKGAQ